MQEFPLPSTCQGCSNNFYYNITLPPTSLRGGYNTVQTKFSPNPYQYRAGYLQQAPSNNMASWASPSSQINLCHMTEEGTKAQSFTWRTSYPWELFLLLSIIWAVFGFWHLLGVGRKGRGQPNGNRYYRTIQEGIYPLKSPHLLLISQKFVSYCPLNPISPSKVFEIGQYAQILMVEHRRRGREEWMTDNTAIQVWFP